jgi:cyclopropane fatty-acyl-phospholipid synthase-like methyltransferase
LGYDTMSHAYRDDHGVRSNAPAEEDQGTYEAWLDELTALLQPGARVLDLGCGAGVPTSRILSDRGFQVTGVDISGVQIERAKSLVPGAAFVQADMAAWDCDPASFEAIVSLYALIHVPLEDQRRLIPRMGRWLVPGGFLLAIVGHDRFTGTDEYLGAQMFWDHADTATYLQWLSDAGLNVIWNRFIPEGSSGHTLVLAQTVVPLTG